MMTVAHLIAPIAFGGGESLLVNLLRERRSGLREIVISVYRSDPFNQRLDEAGITHYELRQKSLGHGIGKAAIGLDTPITLARLPRLFSILRRERIDLLHAHSFPASVLGSVAGRTLGVRGVYTHHFYRAAPSRIERAVLGKCYDAFFACTGVSNLVTESMQRSFPGVAQRFSTIHNCISPAFVAPTPDPEFQSLRNAGRTVFVQVARFASFKNQMLVVEALARLAPVARARIRVGFAGDGPERPSVMARVRELGLSEETLFLGAVPYERIPGLLACADFGLFPSVNEGFGIGAVECMAAGLPVLTLDTELMREIVGDAGLQFPRERFHEGFAAMLDHGPALRDQARKRADRYLPDRIKNEYLALYHRVLSAGFDNQG
jgi:glycosyltransferase involved in cell wall biosynthesis